MILFIYPFIAFFSILYHYIVMGNIKQESILFHFIFMIGSTMIWKDEILLYNTIIYFISDWIYSYINHKITWFSLFHHSFVCISIILIWCKIISIDLQITNLTAYHELSTMLICLVDMRLISQQLYDNIFPITFILCRLIFFNIGLLYLYFTEACVKNINYNNF